VRSPAGERRQEEKSKDKADDAEGKADKEEKKEDAKGEAAKAKPAAPEKPAGPPPAAAAEAPAAALSAEEIEDGRHWSAKVVLFAGMHPRCAPGPANSRAARPFCNRRAIKTADAARSDSTRHAGRGGCADTGAPAAPGVSAQRPGGGRGPACNGAGRAGAGGGPLALSYSLR